MGVELVREQILAAFAGVPKPPPLGLTPHRCAECDRLEADLAPLSPTDISLAVFAKHVWDLPLLSANAKHYYLPAWLLQSLCETEWGGTACDAVLYALDSDHRWDSEPSYTFEQWESIDQWLDFMAVGADEITREEIKQVKGKLPK